MSLGAILAAIPAIAAIVGAIANLFSWVSRIFTKTPEEKSQQIIVDEQKKQSDIEKSGRPE